ncbi:glycosyltransferase family 2 protein [Sphingomonas sp.]|uniref:glycosyltransferase family 2 protein n=1 Tax=Sphingomonas sp. TaxID=28214 RepID=UPI002D809BFC|nr:glycosyltransferase family 2 protein [Sphingomonas sp.]HEU0044476.1 glycosyltransferase family 2 protein [Sphingomonas sp.]
MIHQNISVEGATPLAFPCRNGDGSRVEISFAIPCFNEQANVVAIYEAVTAQAEAHAASHEIIFIDNHSTDRTRELLREICARDHRVRAIFNNRNYGQMRSPTHAIFQADGQAVIAMCCDFQDAPALIGEMVRQWRAGAQVVLGQRRSEKVSMTLGLIRRAGYAFFARFGDYPLIPGATGFGLYDRAVVDTLAQWNEPEPFLRGMVVESGYRMAVLPFDRPPRAGGKSSNSFWTLLNFALSGIGGSAKSLLRLQLVLSIYFFVASVLLAGVAIFRFITIGYSPVALMLTVMLGMFSLVLLFLGLIGDQVRLLSERVRNVPLVIEEERVNFPPSRAEPTRRTSARGPLSLTA